MDLTILITFIIGILPAIHIVSGSGVVQLSWLSRVNLSKLPIESWRQFGHGRNPQECSQLARAFKEFEPNSFLHLENYACIMLQIDMNDNGKDFEEGMDLVYVLGEPWESSYPYFYQLTPQKWTPYSWELNQKRLESSRRPTTTTTWQPENLTRLLITGGSARQPDGGLKFGRSTQILDIEDPTMICQDAPDYYPIDAQGINSEGALLDGMPFLCDLLEEHSTNCQFLGSESTDQFVTNMTLTMSRRGSASILLPGSNDTLWITGGKVKMNSKNAIFVKSTEYISPKNGSRPGPDLPARLFHHCLVQVNDSTLLLVGGISNQREDSKDSYYFDVNLEIWTRGPDLAIARHTHACGRLKDKGFKNGTMIVVAGGKKEAARSTEILVENGLVWTKGPDLPISLRSSVMVSKPDQYQLLVIGGCDPDGGGQSEANFRLTSYLGELSWSRMQQQLSPGRCGHVAMLVPDSLTQCEKTKVDLCPEGSKKFLAMHAASKELSLWSVNGHKCFTLPPNLSLDSKSIRLKTLVIDNSTLFALGASSVHALYLHQSIEDLAWRRLPSVINSSESNGLLFQHDRQVLFFTGSMEMAASWIQVFDIDMNAWSFLGPLDYVNHHNRIRPTGLFKIPGLTDQVVMTATAGNVYFQFDLKSKKIVDKLIVKPSVKSQGRPLTIVLDGDRQGILVKKNKGSTELYFMDLARYTEGFKLLNHNGYPVRDSFTAFTYSQGEAFAYDKDAGQLLTWDKAEKSFLTGRKRFLSFKYHSIYYHDGFAFAGRSI